MPTLAPGAEASAIVSPSLVQHDRDLFSLEHELGWQGGLVPIPVRMTVLRLGDGQLILNSPVPVSSAQEREITGLGSVGFILVPPAHGRFAEQAARQFRDAKLLAAPVASRRRRKLAFQGEVTDQAPASWQGQVESLIVHGFALKEVALFQRSSRTLILSDLCFNIHGSSSPLARARCSSTLASGKPIASRENPTTSNAKASRKQSGGAISCIQIILIIG